MKNISQRWIETISRHFLSSIRCGGQFLSSLLLIIVFCSVALADKSQSSARSQPRIESLANLGRALFNDNALSGDGSTSCSTCHIPEKHFTDGRQTAVGVGGKVLTRNTPSLEGVAQQQSLFWDGRESNLRTQARIPLTSAAEHGLRNDTEVISIVSANKVYAEAFARLLKRSNGAITIGDVGTALEAFQRTLAIGDSPFNRYFSNKDKNAISGAAIRGFALFQGEARCATCHSISQTNNSFSDQKFHVASIRLSDETMSALPELATRVSQAVKEKDKQALNNLISTDKQIAALGRFVATLNPADIGKFKTPTLYNVARTAPYMHDGSIATLAEAIDHELYSRSSAGNYPIALSQSEKLDLLMFLETLTTPAPNL